MRIRFIYIITFILSLSSILFLPDSVFAQLDPIDSEGYYRDIFIDGGVSLSSYGCSSIYAVGSLGLSCYSYTGSSTSDQNSIMIESSSDLNGRLLYPDGNPRFRLIYVNGGSAHLHAESLGETGRQRVRDFFNHGGSYSGSCAGAFLSCHNDDSTYDSYYFHLCPIYMKRSGQSGLSTDMNLPADSALLDYFSFSNNIVEHVTHNGGGSANTHPPGTNTLATYLNAPTNMEGKPSVWSWKDPDSDVKGRVVVTGSHPEGVSCSGGDPRCDLMKSIFLYALDGVGNRQPVKQVLQNGITVSMTANNEKIGDKQYHYYQIDFPGGQSNLFVELNGLTNDDIDLYVSREEKPVRLENHYEFRSISSGSHETVSVSIPEGGTWYVGVYGVSTVPLNGVSYTITASWNEIPPECGNGIIEYGEQCDPPNDDGPCDFGPCNGQCQCPAFQPIDMQYDVNEDSIVNQYDTINFVPWMYNIFQGADFNSDLLVNSLDYGLLVGEIIKEHLFQNLSLYTTLNSEASVQTPAVGVGGTVENATFGVGHDKNAVLIDDSQDKVCFSMEQIFAGEKGTVSFWYKKTQEVTNSARFFADTRASSVSDVDFGLWRGGDDTIIRLVTDGTGPRVEWQEVPSVFDEKWHYIMVTFDTTVGNFELFIDNESQGVLTSSMGGVDISQQICIGNNHLGERPIGGYVDEFKVYTEVISN